MTKYQKYVDDKGEYLYELELENGNKHLVKPELGDYVHKLELSLRLLCESIHDNRLHQSPLKESYLRARKALTTKELKTKEQ